MKNNAFYAAYLFWEIDEFYQNSDRTEDYINKGLKYDKARMFQTEWGFEGLSIEGNPGRHRQICNMFLRSCFRMWFGENCFELVSKEKLESFQGARVNKLVLKNIRFVELYENPHESYTTHNRSIQKKFNEWIDIEGIYDYCFKNFGAKIRSKRSF
jgi:hypothetical protein